MFRRALALGLAALAVALLPTAALAASVQIRVEGVTRTIFGAAPPRVEAANALEALDKASLGAEFYIHVTQTSFGPFVDQIGRFPSAGTSGWVYKVNGISPPVGADAYKLADGDVVLWYYATFDASGAGQTTLDLRRDGGNCYRVFRQDDKGARTAAAGATLAVDGRRVVARGGRACVGTHRGLVRATLAGTVRSNAVQ
ncbi:MAG: DUF4430 domain-containing protein [Actinobacteria bacterium]|nr:DUF4430 domain-containing protein [Actinomycetota bacterium]